MKGGRPSLTARWIASQRIRLDAQRPVRDRAGAGADRALHQSLRHPVLALSVFLPIGMDLRTSFFDGAVLAGIDSGVSQFVVLGAGYDGRSLRFATPGSHWIEVDHPATQIDKQRRIESLGADTGHLTFAGVDLVADDLDAALTRAGHDPSAPTFFMAEGLLTYLPADAIERLVRAIRGRAAAGSTFAVNVRIEDLAGQRRRLALPVDAVLRMLGERRQSHFAPGDLEALLASTGWAVREHRSCPPHPVDGSSLAVVAAMPA